MLFLDPLLQCSMLWSPSASEIFLAVSRSCCSEKPQKTAAGKRKEDGTGTWSGACPVNSSGTGIYWPHLTQKDVEDRARLFAGLLAEAGHLGPCGGSSVLPPPGPDSLRATECVLDSGPLSSWVRILSFLLWTNQSRLLSLVFALWHVCACVCVCVWLSRGLIHAGSRP